MSEEATPEVAPATPVPTVTPEIPDGPKPIGITSEQLSKRLDESRQAASKKLLADLGYESLADAKRAQEAFKVLQTAQLTEKERLEQELKELRPLKDSHSATKELVASLVDEQFGALPEATQAAIDSVANGDPHERLKLIRVMRQAGALTAPPQGEPKPPAPTTTVKAPASPKPTPAQTSWDKYQELEKTSPIMASVFYKTNRMAIEKDRPPSS